MPNFSYKAISSTGEVITGIMQADVQYQVIDNLQSKGLIPVYAKSESSANGLFALLSPQRALLWFTQKPITQQHIVIITQQLATMLNAGLTLENAIQQLIKVSPNQIQKHYLSTLREQIREGVSFADALIELNSPTPIVTHLYINMIRAGESAGTLEHTLQNLSDYLTRLQSLKSTVVSALIYPAMLLLMTVGSLMILLIYVVPGFAPMFEELGADMPALTSVVLSVAYILQHYWWLIFLSTVAIVTAVKYKLRQPRSRLLWHSGLLRLHLFGDLIGKIEMARFSRTLGSLVSNGVPFLRALKFSSAVMSNLVFVDAVNQAILGVKSGRSLSSCLVDNKHFPALAIQMLSVGEESGKLEKMLMQIADIYDAEVKTTIDRLLSLLVPVVILLLAVIIAIIVISILMAVMSVGDLFE